MDMKKILENMDAAANGEKTAAPAEVGSMKAILESIQSVEECGGMEMAQPMSAPEEDKVTMNVSLNARGADAIADLIKLMGGTKEQHIDMPLAHDAMHKDVDSHNAEMPMALPAPGSSDEMAKLIAMASAEHDDVEEEWDNAPEEEYSDTKTMTKDLSGGINREKGAYAAAQDGDNPMAVDENDDLIARLQEELKAALEGKYKSDAQRKAVHAAKDEEDD